MREPRCKFFIKGAFCQLGKQQEPFTSPCHPPSARQYNQPSSLLHQIADGRPYIKTGWGTKKKQTQPSMSDPYPLMIGRSSSKFKLPQPVHRPARGEYLVLCVVQDNRRGRGVGNFCTTHVDDPARPVLMFCIAKVPACEF